MYDYLARRGWVLDVESRAQRTASFIAFLFMVVPPVAVLLERVIPLERVFRSDATLTSLLGLLLIVGGAIPAVVFGLDALGISVIIAGVLMLLTAAGVAARRSRY